MQTPKALELPKLPEPAIPVRYAPAGNIGGFIATPRSETFMVSMPQPYFTADQMNAHYLAGVEAGRAAASGQAGWQPIETAPMTGYFLVCDENGELVRTKLRHEGEWHDVEYPFIEHAPWGDKSVGLDAQRILDSAQRDSLSPMKLGVSDGCPEPKFWCVLPPFHAAPDTASLAASPAVAGEAKSELAKDFPPMGGLTECDMGDSDE